MTADPAPDRAIDTAVARAREQAKQLVSELAAVALPARDRRVAQRLLLAAVDMIGANPGTLDLKIAAATVEEMGDAFSVFAPYTAAPKVTIFGSARTTPDDPLYADAREVARQLAAQGWMIITGAGPGIMQAGMEGAGREQSIGVSIRLPFEQGANPVIAGDDKFVSMKYFFTRKLMLVKESKGFISLPGGFGTIDETFELLTLTQTGKGMPVPIVFLETPGDFYWQRVLALMQDQLMARRLIEPSDLELFDICSGPAETVAVIERFYRVYDSLRFVGDWLVLRVKRPLDDSEIALLNERFGFLCPNGPIERTAPLRDEVADDDQLALARVRLRFDKRHWSDLHRLIGTINELTPADT